MAGISRDTGKGQRNGTKQDTPSTAIRSRKGQEVSFDVQFSDLASFYVPCSKRRRKSGTRILKSPRKLGTSPAVSPRKHYSQVVVTQGRGSRAVPAPSLPLRKVIVQSRAQPHVGKPVCQDDVVDINENKEEQLQRNGDTDEEIMTLNEFENTEVEKLDQAMIESQDETEIQKTLRLRLTSEREASVLRRKLDLQSRKFEEERMKFKSSELNLKVQLEKERKILNRTQEIDFSENLFMQQDKRVLEDTVRKKRIQFEREESLLEAENISQSTTLPVSPEAESRIDQFCHETEPRSNQLYLETESRRDVGTETESRRDHICPETEARSDQFSTEMEPRRRESPVCLESAPARRLVLQPTSKAELAVRGLCLASSLLPAELRIVLLQGRNEADWRLGVSGCVATLNSALLLSLPNIGAELPCLEELTKSLNFLMSSQDLSLVMETCVKVVESLALGDVANLFSALSLAVGAWTPHVTSHLATHLLLLLSNLLRDSGPSFNSPKLVRIIFHLISLVTSSPEQTRALCRRGEEGDCPLYMIIQFIGRR